MHHALKAIYIHKYAMKYCIINHECCLQVKFVTLQKQHANSMRALMSDLNKTCGQSQVIQNECQV